LRSDRERLLDILESVERIEAQAARGRAAFTDDEVAQSAVVRWVQIIEKRPEDSRKSCGRCIPRCRGGRWWR
jgi:uncharacterized protein with HEPN domain